MTDYLIQVRERASKERVFHETYSTDDEIKAEQRAGRVWDQYARSPDRYRLEVFRKGEPKRFMCIE